MSVRALARVWADSKQAGTELLMMLAIADFADDDGNAYPSVGTLATKCRMSTRNANHLLAALRASGELDIAFNAGPHGCNRYRITLTAAPLKRASPPKAQKPLKPASPPAPEAAVTPEAPVTLKPVAGTPEAGNSKPLKPASDEPSLNRQEPSERARKRAHPDRPEGVTEQVWTDWLALRKAKRAPVTRTVLEEAGLEAAKAGMPLDAFLRVWCVRGSQGLKAAWLAADERGQHVETIRDRAARERAAQFAPSVAARPPGQHVPQPTAEVIDVAARRVG